VRDSHRSAAFPPRLRDGLDVHAFDELCRTTEDEEFKLKYSDLDHWLTRSWKEVVRLELDRGQSLDILDLGLGPGYFAYVCQRIGHHCVGLDRPGGSTFKDALRKWLGVHRVVESSILPRTPLPELGRFDLVTAYRCQFNYNPHERRLWNLDEWAFFLDDLRGNVLKPSGRFVLKLTRQQDKGRAGLRRDNPALVDLFVQRGARERGNVLIFDPLL
jgi:SAM-dependent methyltransferase